MTLPERADVVIVGGGFAGAATAYELSRAGAGDVVLLESEGGLGHHASGRNAALGRQLVEEEHTSDLTVRGAAFLRDPEPGFAELSLWNPVGSILLADTAEEVSRLCRRAAARGIAHERISMAEAAERAPHFRGVSGAGGMYVPGDGVIDVHALLMAFIGGARRGGAHVALGCEVRAIRREAGTREPLRVVTRHGDIASRCVVAAGGAWAARIAALAGGKDPGLAPIRRHLFVTERIPGLDPNQPFVWHLGAEELYARPEGGGLLVSVCDEEVAEPGAVGVAPWALDYLAEKLTRSAPRIAELGVARVWACQRTFAPDRRPVVGWDPDVPELFWVAGLGGHGATASPAIGADAAAGILARLY